MSNVRDTIIRFFQGKGVPDYAIYGILGNLDIESSLDPTAYNAGEGAIGLAQWENSRRSALQAYAARHGGSETDLNTQLNFLWHEMNTSESDAWHRVLATGNVQDAAAAWDQYYERSSGSSRQQRVQQALAYAGGKGDAGSIGSGGGMGADSASGGSPSMTDYQGVDSLGALLDQVPELRHLVDKALAGSWSTQKFENAIEDSDWWKKHSSTARAILVQQANDPAAYAQSLRNTQNSVQSLANQLGFKVNSQQLKAIASSALLSGNDGNQQWLTQQLGNLQNYTHLTSTGGLQGGMAATVQQLQSLASDYGFNWTPAQLGQYAQGILTGQTTVDTYKERLIGWAKSAFPALADEIDKGSTVKQLADPYVNSMSQLLEVDPGSLNVYTPLIRKAMQGYVDPTTKQRTAMTLSDFETQVRNDPRWQYTQNAKDTFSSALVRVGQDFGFAV